MAGYRAPSQRGPWAATGLARGACFAAVRVFAVLRDGCGWRCPGFGGCRGTAAGCAGCGAGCEPGAGRLTAELREENGRLRAENAEQAAELEKLRADLAVLQRMVFGRAVGAVAPEPPGGADEGPTGRVPGPHGEETRPGGTGRAAGLLAPAPARGVLGFSRGRVLLPGMRGAVHAAGRSLVRGAAGLAGDRAAGDTLPPPLQAGLRLPGAGDGDAPGPPKAVGKGLFTNAFIAMLLVERFTAGRSQNSLVKGLARQGADISPATLAGTRARPGRCWPRSRRRSRSGHGAPGTCTRMRRRGGSSRRRTGAGRRSGGCGCSSARTRVGFVMDPTRSGRSWPATPGIDQDTGQLAAGEDGGPRRLVISSDFYLFTSLPGRRPTAW